jgi:tetratricopeptide (TPR) repeat protein
LRFGPRLAEFWRVRGYGSEGRHRLAEILALPGASASTTERARTLYGAGVLAHEQGDFTAAQALYQQSLAIHQELGNVHEVMSCREVLAVMARYQGDYAKARSLYERFLAAAREIGNKKEIATSLYGIGYTAYLELIPVGRTKATSDRRSWRSDSLLG